MKTTNKKLAKQRIYIMYFVFFCYYNYEILREFSNLVDNIALYWLIFSGSAAQQLMVYNFMHTTKVIDSQHVNRLVNLVAILCLGVLSACASAPKQYGIRGEGDQVLNRDINGKSLSVVVRVYQLRDAREFSKLTFDTLASGHPEAELLGPALLDRTDAIVVPGGNYVSSEKLHEEARFVGIVALFRNPDPRYWRQLVSVDSMTAHDGFLNKEKGVSFRVQDCYVMINGAKPIPLPDQTADAHPECGAPRTSGARANIRQTGPSNYPSNQQTRQQAPAQANRGQRPNVQSQSRPSANVNTSIVPTNMQFGVGRMGTVNVGTQPAQPPSQDYYNAPNNCTAQNNCYAPNNYNNDPY